MKHSFRIFVFATVVATSGFAQGVAELEERLRQDPSQANLYGELGKIYMREKQFERAAQMFEKRFKLDPNATMAYLNYANCNIILGRIDPARIALRHAISQRSQFLPAHLTLARVLVQPKYKNDSLQTARAEFQTVINLGDTAVSKYKNELVESYRGIAYTFVLEKRYADALEPLDKAVKLSPNDVQAHLLRAQILALMNRREEAIQEYEKVLQLDLENKQALKGLEVLLKR